jgi:S1-C subfamily serine protease
VDYTPLLAPAGFLIKKEGEGKAYIGNPRFQEKEGLTLTSNTLRGTPLYDAGLDIDDRLTALDGQPITTVASLTGILDQSRPGATVSVRYFHHGVEKTGALVLAESPAWKIVTYEQEGKPVTPAILQFRNSWLGGK